MTLNEWGRPRRGSTRRSGGWLSSKEEEEDLTLPWLLPLPSPTLSSPSPFLPLPFPPSHFPSLTTLHSPLSSLPPSTLLPPPPCLLSPAFTSSFSLLVEGILHSPLGVCFVLCLFQDLSPCFWNTNTKRKMSSCNSVQLMYCLPSSFLCIFLYFRFIFAFIYFIIWTPASGKFPRNIPLDVLCCRPSHKWRLVYIHTGFIVRVNTIMITDVCGDCGGVQAVFTLLPLPHCR